MRDLTVGALASLTGAAVALLVRIAEPFEHGTWLVAYLVLVGFVAQLLLGRGQTAVLLAAGRAPPPAGVRLAQALLWNAGVIAVPAGVLSESRLLVVAGSLSLIAALASLCTSVPPALSAAAAPRPWLVWGYSSLLVAMLFSVCVGTGLAWDLPWV